MYHLNGEITQEEAIDNAVLVGKKQTIEKMYGKPMEEITPTQAIIAELIKDVGSLTESLDTLYEEVENVTGKNRNKSKLVARQELTVFNAQLNKKRAANLGFNERTWNAVGGSTENGRTAERKNRKGYGFEIKKEFWTKGNQWLNEEKQIKKDIEKYGFEKTKLEKQNPTLWTL